jgi:hypothetical protein
MQFLVETMKRYVMAGLLVWAGADWATGETIYRSFGIGRSHDLGTSPDVLDLNSDGTDDFRLSWDSSNTVLAVGGFYAPFLFAGMNGASFSLSASSEVSIPDGSEIGPASGWWTEGNTETLATFGAFSMTGSRSWTDLLVEEGSHTIGVRFEADEGGFRYGWIRYRDYVDGSGEWGPQVFDFAYNSVPDQPILSAIVPVPEPGTTALLGLGAAVLTGHALRRRNRR